MDRITLAAIRLTRDLSPTALTGDASSRPGVDKAALAELVAALDEAHPGQVNRARVRPGILRRPR